jgi:hypothetical protein
VAADQLTARALATVEVQDDDAVDRLAGGAMVLAHRQHPLARGIELEIGVAQPAVACGRDRPRLAPLLEPVEPLVGEVDRDDHALADRVSAAPVFVDPRADVERRRGHIRGGARERPAHQHGAPAFLWPGLEPVGDLAIEHRLGEPDLGGGDQIGADR